MRPPPASAPVQTAHGDAWQELGRLRIAQGGATAELPGARLMASGLQQAQWNGVDVTDPRVVDVARITRWYAERDAAWGLHVPAAMAWSRGRHLFRKRLMGTWLAAEYAESAIPGLVLEAAAGTDLDAVAAVDHAAFDGEADLQRRWLEPHLDAEQVSVVLARLDGEQVGTAYVLLSDGRAGPAAYVAGVAVVPSARRRGVAAAMSVWLLRRAYERGARLAHLHPDTDEAARVYARLGFAEVEGLDVFADVT